MAYQDFIAAFAVQHGIASAEELLSEYADRYSFQIKSRERARAAHELLAAELSRSFEGLRVLDVGCAYGSFAIEFAKAGAIVTGTDISQKWLDLAEINAQDEAEVTFVKCDASSRSATRLLKEFGPYDLVIVNDVFEHIYDTPGLLGNLHSLMEEGAHLYFKIPNGLATRNVLLEGHKKVFALSLLPPDYWQMFVSAPFHIYYHRQEYYEALFKRFDLKLYRNLNPVRDPDIDHTHRAIQSDLSKLRRALRNEQTLDERQLSVVRKACSAYLDEAADDLETLDWDSLYQKYRVTFWEGILRKKGETRTKKLTKEKRVAGKVRA